VFGDQLIGKSENDDWLSKLLAKEVWEKLKRWLAK
jgi:hypothetical protein